MDERDRQILELLRQDAWVSYVDLARQVHLSASAVQRRVERLKREGVLLGANARVAQQPDQARMRVYALVELIDDHEATVSRFRRQIDRNGAVIEAHYVTGEADVVLTLELADIGAYDAFVRRYFGQSSLVKRFKTLTSLRALKAVA
ncbi:MAG: Lrp/AsnC family transcriptional regulator [Hyphomonadaceae bacterium]|nr:Lrp/AsnC family transcriptional regulator [Hyphomonadaceae bacterium]